MLKNKYNIIMISICTFLLLLTIVVLGINASNNSKYDLTRELYDDSIEISLVKDNKTSNESMTVKHEISSIKWKSHKGDYLGDINIVNFATDIEHPEREEGDTTPIKPEEYILNFRLDLKKEFDGDFSLERLTILEKDVDKKNAIKKYGKLEAMTSLSLEQDDRMTFSDVRQDIVESYYQIYVLHFVPSDENVIENYWYFGAYFDVIPEVNSESNE